MVNDIIFYSFRGTAITSITPNATVADTLSCTSDCKVSHMLNSTDALFQFLFSLNISCPKSTLYKNF